MAVEERVRKRSVIAVNVKTLLAGCRGRPVRLSANQIQGQRRRAFSLGAQVWRNPVGGTRTQVPTERICISLDCGRAETQHERRG